MLPGGPFAPCSPSEMYRQRTPATRTTHGDARAASTTASHRGDELEVVAVRVGKRRDQHLALVAGVVRLLDDVGAGRLEPLEVAAHVGRLDVEDHPARLLVPALHGVV